MLGGDMTREMIILLIDDDELMYKSIKRILSENNVIIDYYQNALEALLKANQIPAPRYDVVLCDINMPVVNGIEIAQQIYDRYPILLITGFLDNYVKERILNICDASLEKLDASERIYPALLSAIRRGKSRLSFKDVA